MLIAISLLMVVVNFSSAEEAAEHIHKAQAVMNQTFTHDIKTNAASFEIETLDKSIEFSLEANTRLIGKSVTLDDNIALFKGKISGNENSWARFTRINGKIEGAFFDGADLFMVKSYSEISSMLDYNALNQQESSYAQSSSNTSVIVNVEDIESSGTCALHNDQINRSEFDIETNLGSFDYDRYIDYLNDMLSGQADKEIQISLFADTQFVSSSTDATAEMLALLNIADGIYSEQIGVQFVLTEATELSDNGTLTSTNPTTLIVAFRNTGFSNPGVSHLFTGKDLDGSTVGIAYVGSLCRNSSVGLTQKYGSKTAIIFAHELGHNFGSPHDNESGSACSSTPSGFIMNPNVNSSGSTFSSCSVERILPVVAQAVGNCIADVSLIAPTITSVANTVATIESEYFYDADGIVDADGTAPFTYSLDIAPSGMTISDTGQIYWLPTQEHIGSNEVQVRLLNQAGSDIQIFTIVIDNAASNEFINFNLVKTISYGELQDVTKSADVGETSYELILTGNTWRSIPIDYEITADTVIQFDFKSDVEAEIQGVVFDNDNTIDQQTTFQIFGTQKYGIQVDRYNNLGSTQSILIPIGQYLQGTFSKLAFVHDNDGYTVGANSVFTNVIVYEDTVDFIPIEPEPVIPVLNFNELEITSHLQGNQDFGDNLEIIEQGNGLRIEGNSWKKVILDTTSITPTTVIKFDFKSDSISEIHGLGFLTGNVIDASRTFQLAGVQNYGIQDFTYTLKGEWETFVIPIGQYLTISEVELVFILDNDRNITADSNFRNIQFVTE